MVNVGVSKLMFFYRWRGHVPFTYNCCNAYGRQRYRCNDVKVKKAIKGCWVKSARRNIYTHLDTVRLTEQRNEWNTTWQKCSSSCVLTHLIRSQTTRISFPILSKNFISSVESDIYLQERRVASATSTCTNAHSEDTQSVRITRKISKQTIQKKKVWDEEKEEHFGHLEARLFAFSFSHHLPHIFSHLPN